MPLNPVSLEARQISLSYGTTEVLRDVTLKIAPSEFFAMLGPSGHRAIGPSGYGAFTWLRLTADF